MGISNYFWIHCSKIKKISQLGNIRLKFDCIYGSISYGFRETILFGFSFAIFPGLKLFCGKQNFIAKYSNLRGKFNFFSGKSRQSHNWLHCWNHDFQRCTFWKFKYKDLSMRSRWFKIWFWKWGTEKIFLWKMFDVMLWYQEKFKEMKMTNEKLNLFIFVAGLHYY